jgi:hypothetical protein
MRLRRSASRFGVTTLEELEMQTLRKRWLPLVLVALIVGGPVA